jgi:SAM-dependent methyltransferase
MDSMVTQTTACLYERPALREVGGETIRPGGLALTDEALELCALPPGARVLDVGCGTGATVAHLVARRDLAAFGLDLSTVLLSSGPQANVPLVQGRGERLPIGSGLLDAVFAECSLSAMAEADQVLDELNRVLRPEGILAISDLYARTAEELSAAPPLPPGTCLSGLRSQAQICERLRAHGFEITAWQDHTAALKQLAVQLIFAHGSLQEFWQQATGGAATATQRAMARVKPGYYLLLARKGKA